MKGNAQTIYFMQEDDSPDIIGLLVLESGDLTFFIEEKQVVKITYRNNPVYTIYPMDKIPPDVDLFLKDFKWEAKRRPAQRDVFDRTIRPSIRAAKSSQSRPQFPIAARIDAFKRRLIESRRWERPQRRGAARRDRVDVFAGLASARTGGGEPAGRSARRKCERDLAVERGLFSYRGRGGDEAEPPVLRDGRRSGFCPLPRRARRY